MPEHLFIGIATPQANPTVELECRELLSEPVMPVITRLTSTSSSPEERLLEYFRTMRSALNSFDTLPLKAFGFACTGSSYLVGQEQERQTTRELSARCGLPVVTAAEAIRSELNLLHAQTIAVLAPYPENLCDKALSYWRQCNLTVTALYRMNAGEDTRTIYDITIDAVRRYVHKLDITGIDALLISGTGMPTLDLVVDNDIPVPVISSNYCLAYELRRQIGDWPVDKPGAANEPPNQGRLTL